MIFFGSGPVAAKSLELLANSFAIEAVVTKPRPPHHKGDVPVLEVSERLNLPVILASNKRELSEVLADRTFASPLAILIDFGIIVTQDVIDKFPLGIVNSHFSLLPEWRGADPITFSILSGQEKTGVSLMLLVEGMDEGQILAYGEYDLPADITTSRLTNGLIQLSDALLKTVIPKYLSGEAKLLEQDEAARRMGRSAEPSYSRKLTKEDGIIDWTKPAEVIEREIRAFDEWPKSRTKLGNLDVVITSSKVVHKQMGEPGRLTIHGKSLTVACGIDGLEILRLKPAGKNEMSADSFLAGYRSQLS